MKNQESLKVLFESVADLPHLNANQALHLFLSQLVHDLNSPRGVLGLELYSAREASETIAKALSAGDVDTIREQLAALQSILNNLDLAYSKLSAIINAMEQVRSAQA